MHSWLGHYVDAGGHHFSVPMSLQQYSACA